MAILALAAKAAILKFSEVVLKPSVAYNHVLIFFVAIICVKICDFAKIMQNLCLNERIK